MIKTVRVFDEPEIQNPHGISARKLHDSEHGQVMHILLKPGEKVPEHATPMDIVFFVLEGDGVIIVGGERVDVTKDTLVEGPANMSHGVVNNGSGVLRVLVIRRPMSK